MGLEQKLGMMEVNMKVNILMEKNKVKEFILGQMGKKYIMYICTELLTLF